MLLARSRKRSFLGSRRLASPWRGEELGRNSSSSNFVPSFCLLPGLGLGLSLQFHPGGIVAAGLPFGLLRRDPLRCLVCP